MLKVGLVFCLAMGCVIAMAGPAQAGTYTDDYWGGSIEASQTDYLGWYFDVTKADVVFSNGTLTVRYYTKWAQAKYDGKVNNTFVEDIFIDFDGYAIPSGNASRFDDADDHGRDSTDTTDLSNSIWDAVIHVDNTTSIGNDGGVDSGTAAIYDYNSDNIVRSLVSGPEDVDGTDGVWSNSTTNTGYRHNQEVRVELQDDASALGTGTWEFFGDDGSGTMYEGVEFVIDISNTNYDWTQWAMKWSVTCANDVVFINNNAVPEPGSALLVLGGLLSGVVARRRRKAKLAS